MVSISLLQPLPVGQRLAYKAQHFQRVIYDGAGPPSWVRSLTEPGTQRALGGVKCSAAAILNFLISFEREALHRALHRALWNR